MKSELLLSYSSMNFESAMAQFWQILQDYF